MTKALSLRDELNKIFPRNPAYAQSLLNGFFNNVTKHPNQSHPIGQFIKSITV